MRYIELNPVRAVMVPLPGDYAWPSYACNAAGKPDLLIVKHPIYVILGSNEIQYQYAYRELFRNSLDADEVHSICESLNRGLVLGRDDFKKIEQMTSRQTIPQKLVGRE